MPLEPIASRENPRIKQMVKLMRSKAARTQAGCFVTEGAKLSCEAATEGALLRELYYTQAAASRYPDRLALLRQKAVLAFELTPALAEKLGDTQTTQGVFALCDLPAPALREDTLSPGRYLALESLQDPGNIGTIVRTADAFALDGLLLTVDCPDLFSSKVLRAAMGSVFRVPVCLTSDLPALLHRLGSTHETYAAVLSEGAVSVRSCDLTRPSVVVIGNEGAGLTEAAVQACAHRLIIDMPGRAESLNAAMAAGVILWEMSRTR